MSFAKRKEFIELDDTVMLYVGPTKIHAIQVVPKINNRHGQSVENIFQTTYGSLKVETLVGKKFGSKVQLSKGWGYVLYPTPELWTVTLPHRTQILYFHDISMIVLQLDLKPGSVVVEAGTGSGSLSHALARAVGSSGKLRTFDFHASRVAVAKAEFQAHGLSDVVEIQQRDVVGDGFGDDLDGQADAIFLDLPKPWEVISHAVKAMKASGGRFVSFSPCIEQVQKTTLALIEKGFLDVATSECLLKELQVTKKSIPILELDFLKTKKMPAPPAVDSAKRQFGGKERDGITFSTGLSAPTVPGHTGYLTAATLPPVRARRSKRLAEPDVS